MKIISDVEQGTQEWLELRLGIATCSELDTLLVNGKGEAGFGAGAFTYMDTLIGERITGEAADPFTGNRHTERGQELEGTGRQLFESQTGVTTQQVGIILNHGIGYSPDVLQRIGEPYVTNRHRDDKAGGLGLGLFIAKTLLERSGARLRFENRPPETPGARVEIVWPRHRMEA